MGIIVEKLPDLPAVSKGRKAIYPFADLKSARDSFFVPDEAKLAVLKSMCRQQGIKRGLTLKATIATREGVAGVRVVCFGSREAKA